MRSCKNEIEDGASAPQINSLVVMGKVATEHFRGFVLSSACVGHHEETIGFAAVKLFGHIEVNQSHLVSIDDDVIGVDVPMTYVF